LGRDTLPKGSHIAQGEGDKPNLVMSLPVSAVNFCYSIIRNVALI